MRKKGMVQSKSKLLNYYKNNYQLYLMLLPGIASLLLFSYVPLYGIYMAFVDYLPSKGVFGSEYIGWVHFANILTDPKFFRMVRNTLALSGLKLIFAFPASIVLALLINELRCKLFKKVFQTVSYLPFFISWIVISSMATAFLSTDEGLLNKIIVIFGGSPVSWYQDPSKWWAILTVTNIWKNVGWGTIMYLASLTSIDEQLYEAAKIDGAGRMRQTLNITIPGLMPIIMIQFVLTIGNIFKDDFEQIFALVGMNTTLAETTEVISTSVFAAAVQGMFTYFPPATAMGLLQGIISLILIIIANTIISKRGYNGLW